MPFVVLGSVSFLSWFISMLAGGGSPLVLIPLVSFLVGAQQVAPIITIGMLMGNTQRLLFFWREVDWQVVRWYFPGAIAGAVLGAYALTYIHVEGIQLFIGIALLLMVAHHWLSKVWTQNSDRVFQLKPWHFMPCAFFYAFGSGLIGSTGPIMNPVYLNYGLTKEKMIATKSVNVLVIHVVKILTYLALGILGASSLTYGLVIGLSAIPANWLGKWVLNRMSGDQFRQVAFTFIAISGVLMLWEQRNLWVLW